MDGSIFPHVVTKLLLGPVRAKAGVQGKSEIDECLGTFLETPSHLARTKAGECDSRHQSPSQGQHEGAVHTGTPPTALHPVGLQWQEGPHVFEWPSLLVPLIRAGVSNPVPGGPMSCKV